MVLDTTNRMSELEAKSESGKPASSRSADALLHSLATDVARGTYSLPVRHWALPNDDQATEEQHAESVHQIASALSEIARDLDTDAEAPYDEELEHDGSKYFVNIQQQTEQRQLMTDMQEKINAHMQTNQTAVMLLEQVQPHASDELDKALNELEAASTATSRYAEFQVDSTMKALAQIEESWSVKPRRRSLVAEAFSGPSSLSTTFRSKTTPEISKTGAATGAPGACQDAMQIGSSSQHSDASASQQAAVQEDGSEEVQTGGSKKEGLQRLSGLSSGSVWAATSRFGKIASQPDDALNAKPEPLQTAASAMSEDDSEWALEDWAEYKEQSEAKRVKLQAELDHAHALLKRARAQVVDLKIGSFRQHMNGQSGRLPGARRTEAFVQTDPTQDEAIKRILHEQINAKDAALEDVTKRLEEAEKKIPPPLPVAPAASLKASMSAASVAGELMKRSSSLTGLTTKSKSVEALRTTGAERKQSFKTKAPVPVVQKVEKATMTDSKELVDVDGLKAELKQFKHIAATSISTEDHEREIGALKEKAAAQQQQLETHIRHLEAADKGDMVATLHASIHEMREGAKDLLSRLPMHIYATVRADAMSLFELSLGETQEIEAKLPKHREDVRSGSGPGSRRASGEDIDAQALRIEELETKLQRSEREIVSTVLDGICNAVVEKEKVEANMAKKLRLVNYNLEAAVKLRDMEIEAATAARAGQAAAEAEKAEAELKRAAVEDEKARIEAAMEEMVRLAANAKSNEIEAMVKVQAAEPSVPTKAEPSTPPSMPEAPGTATGAPAASLALAAEVGASTRAPAPVPELVASAPATALIATDQTDVVLKSSEETVASGSMDSITRDQEQSDAERAKLQAELDHANALLSEANAKIEELEAAQAIAKASAVASAAESSLIETDLEQPNAGQKTLQAELDNAQTLLAEANAKIKELEASCAQAASAAQAAESRAEAAGEVAASEARLLQSQLDALRDGLAGTNAVRSLLTKELDNADNEIAEAAMHSREFFAKLTLASEAAQEAARASDKAAAERLDAIRRLAEVESQVAFQEQAALETAEKAVADATAEAKAIAEDLKMQLGATVAKLQVAEVENAQLQLTVRQQQSDLADAQSELAAAKLDLAAATAAVATATASSGAETRAASITATAEMQATYSVQRHPSPDRSDRPSSRGRVDFTEIDVVSERDVDASSYASRPCTASSLRPDTVSSVRPGTASSLAAGPPLSWAEANERATRGQLPHHEVDDDEIAAAAVLAERVRLRNGPPQALSPTGHGHAIRLREWRPNSPIEGAVPSIATTRLADPPSRPRSAKASPTVVQREHIWVPPFAATQGLAPSADQSPPRQPTASVRPASRSALSQSYSAATPFLAREQRAIVDHFESNLRVGGGPAASADAAATLLAEGTLEALLNNASSDAELKEVAAMLVKRIATLEASNKQLLSLSGTRVGTPASDRLEPDAPMYSKLQGDWGRKHAETLFQMAIRSATGGEVIKSSTSGRRGATPKAFQEGASTVSGVFVGGSAMRTSASAGSLPIVKQAAAKAASSNRGGIRPSGNSSEVRPFTPSTSAFLSRGLITPESLIEETQRNRGESRLGTGTRMPGTPSARGGGVVVGMPVEFKFEPSRLSTNAQSVSIERGRPTRAAGAITSPEARSSLVPLPSGSGPLLRQQRAS